MRNPLKLLLGMFRPADPPKSEDHMCAEERAEYEAYVASLPEGCGIFWANAVIDRDGTVHVGGPGAKWAARRHGVPEPTEPRN